MNRSTRTRGIYAWRQKGQSDVVEQFLNAAIDGRVRVWEGSLMNQFGSRVRQDEL